MEPRYLKTNELTDIEKALKIELKVILSKFRLNGKHQKFLMFVESEGKQYGVVHQESLNYEDYLNKSGIILNILDKKGNKLNAIDAQNKGAVASRYQLERKSDHCLIVEFERKKGGYVEALSSVDTLSQETFIEYKEPSALSKYILNDSNLVFVTSQTVNQNNFSKKRKVNGDAPNNLEGNKDSDIAKKAAKVKSTVNNNVSYLNQEDNQGRESPTSNPTHLRVFSVFQPPEIVNTEQPAVTNQIQQVVQQPTINNNPPPINFNDVEYLDECYQSFYKLLGI